MRIRWLQANQFGRAALRRAVRGMTDETFSEAANSGFLIERQRGDFVEAKYVERFDWIETVNDPFGGSQEISRQQFQQTAFRLSVDSPTIEIYDAPRSIAPLLSRLEVFLGLDFVVSPPAVELLPWLSEIEKKLEQVVVTSVGVSKVSLSAQTFAHIAVKGTEDVRAQVAKFLGKKSYKLDKLVATAVHDDVNIRFMLRDDSRANIISGSNDFMPVLRDGLARVLAQDAG